MRRSKKFMRWSTWKRAILAVTRYAGISALALLTVNIILNVLGNRADAWFGEAVVSFLLGPFYIPLWFVIPLVIVVALLIVKLIFDKNQEVAIRERAQNVADLHLTAQTAIAKMTNEIDDLEDNISKTLLKLLSDLISAFPGETFRAAIFRPDANKKYLNVWVHVGLDAENLPNDSFCISNCTGEDDRHGVAGWAWRQKTPQYVHIIKDGPDYKGDHDHYTPTRAANEKPPYESLVEIPLIGPGHNQKPIAVLSCDSAKRDTFDDPIDREMLNNMAAAITRTIVVYNALQQLRSRLAQTNQQQVMPSGQFFEQVPAAPTPVATNRQPNRTTSRTKRGGKNK
jgi:hypothetical protein